MDGCNDVIACLRRDIQFRTKVGSALPSRDHDREHDVPLTFRWNLGESGDMDEEMELSVGGGHYVGDNTSSWICCDRCNKWRHVFDGVQLNNGEAKCDDVL